LTQPQQEERQAVEELVLLTTFSGNHASVLEVLAQMVMMALLPKSALVALAALGEGAARPVQPKGSLHCLLAISPAHSWYRHLLCWIKSRWLHRPIYEQTINTIHT